MGMCYDVSLTLSYDDEQAVVDRIKKAIEEIDAVFKAPASESLADMVKVLITDSCFEENREDKGRVRFESSFSASYGWEQVMIDAFQIMAPALRDGSMLYIMPDSGYDKLVVQSGAAVQLH